MRDVEGVVCFFLPALILHYYRAFEREKIKFQHAEHDVFPSLPPVFAIHHYLCRTHDHVSRFRIEKGGSTFMRDNVPLIFVFFILFIPTRGLCFFGFLRANLIIGNIEQATCTDRC